MNALESAVLARDITILVFGDCPHRDLALGRVTDAAHNLGAGVLLEDAQVRTLTAEDAAAEGFAGSPTILIDGADPFPVTGGGTAACRLYRTEAGLEGSPSVSQLEEALRR